MVEPPVERAGSSCLPLGIDVPAGVSIPDVVLLNEPAGGTPSVITTERGLRRVADVLASQNGPVAVDTERASGIRYGQRAFLVQLKRGESGVVLIDPEAFDDLSLINRALAGAEWVLHAATQDLPCLADLGMYPDALFDTELGGRLAGFERVGLGFMVENLLGYRLAKEHSAVDWSHRPLPTDWLNYAALDVDILLDLRDAVEEELRTQGKLEYALEEFRFVAEHPEREEKPDPWRKTKGIRDLKTRRQLTTLRNLWYERDHLARAKDVAPKRLLPDSALITAARLMPRSVPAVLQIPGFQTRALKREAPRWVRAVAEAKRAEELVPFTTPASGPPPIKAWEAKRPESARLIAVAKPLIFEIGEELGMPQENVLAPDILRRLCWEPPAGSSEGEVRVALLELGARNWQIERVSHRLAAVLEQVRGG
ncbi:HRDC domain-containing protein [Rothia nasisuis]|uniref:HRDC domain-containing protein n=1 Tax=Rothia nasisuis TaxID=2109647 RepID=UPI001F1E118F|nr:ribonuclease D [Rothia nasisuis]